MNRVVGKITEEEKQAIQELFERKNGLAELLKILTPENDLLYEKLIRDMGSTATRFQQWWDNMYEKYQWQKSENGHWKVNFVTNEIILDDEAEK